MMAKFSEGLASLACSRIDGRLIRKLRVVVPLIYILLTARLLAVTFLVASVPERVLIAGWMLICLLCWRRAAVYPVLFSLVLAPIVSFWQLTGAAGWHGWPSSSFVPFACASSFWLVRWLFSPDRHRHSFALAEWLAECLALLVAVKVAVGFMTPSLTNALWRLATVPDDMPFTEVQGMSAGFYLLSMTVAFRICLAEAGGKCPGAEILLRTLLVQFLCVFVFALSQYVLAIPPLEREALHSPFFGIHEMGFYAACFFSFAVVAVAFFSGSKNSLHSLRGLYAVLLGSLFLLFFSGSKSGWIAALIGSLAGVFGLGTRRVFAVVAALVAVSAASFATIQVLPNAFPSQNFLPPRLQHLLGSGLLLGGEADQIRWGLMNKGAILAQSRLLDGVGTGDFRISETKDTLAATRHLPQEKRNHSDAHNIFLQILAETGIGGLVLFAGLALLCVSVGLGVGAPGLAKAGAAAVVAGFAVNSINDVIAWPWQALTFGVFLSLPLVLGNRLSASAPAARNNPLLNLAPLAPTLLAILMAPWSIKHDLLLQGRSFGVIPRTVYSSDFPVFEALPCGRLEIPRDSPARFFEIQPVPTIPAKRKIRLHLAMNGQTLIGEAPCSRPKRFEIEAAATGGPSSIEWSTSGLRALWQRTRGAPFIWWITLLDERGKPLDPGGFRPGGRSA